MDKEKFQEELVNLFLSIYTETTTNAKVEQYQSQLTNLIDTLAPIKRKKVQMDMKQPWYDEQVGKLIQLRQLKERKWKNSRNEYD